MFTSQQKTKRRTTEKVVRVCQPINRARDSFDQLVFVSHINHFKTCRNNDDDFVIKPDSISVLSIRSGWGIFNYQLKRNHMRILETEICLHDKKSVFFLNYDRIEILINIFIETNTKKNNTEHISRKRIHFWAL